MTAVVDQRTTHLGWMRAGGALFGELFAALPDRALDEASLLPGWTRRHVAAHVAFNAQGLVRLLDWARTGVRTPMYPDPEARNRQIAEGARLGTLALRHLVVDSEAKLLEAAKTLPAAAWSAPVVTAQGRTVPAAEVPWMRTREVWVHAVDLANGTTFESFPPRLLDALLDDTASRRRARGQLPGLVVSPTDRSQVWDMTVDGQPHTALVGSAARLVAVLTGRTSHPVGARSTPADPEVGRWL